MQVHRSGARALARDGIGDELLKRHRDLRVIVAGVTTVQGALDHALNGSRAAGAAA